MGITPLSETYQTRYYNVTRKEGDFKSTCPFRLYKNIKEILGVTSTITKSREGKICIGVTGREKEETLKQLKTLAGHEVEVTPHQRLNTSRGVVICRDLMNSSVDVIKEGLEDQGVLEVRRMNTRRNGQIVPSASLILTFDTPICPEEIRAAFYKLKVRPYIPSPQRCYRCQRFGHISLRCKSPQEFCECGREAHPKESGCADPPTCVNCGGCHTSRSASCPILSKEREIQKMKVMNRMSFREARAVVDSKSTVGTYAQAAALPTRGAKAPEKNPAAPPLKGAAVKAPTSMLGAKQRVADAIQPQKRMVTSSSQTSPERDPTAINKKAPNKPGTIMPPPKLPPPVAAATPSGGSSRLNWVTDLEATSGSETSSTATDGPVRRKKGWQKGRPRPNLRKQKSKDSE
ncbi:uncharacterized protein LOC106672001 [Cimex lectularius]|uniref:CCHC-type domain-containing protein n=1 Tax=Cimex lectularius TaxID=79782 RepID=A0A8I6TH02_CIMLE|nr:uncharacterized protein LOC106672001 [Cimex lectularius]